MSETTARLFEKPADLVRYLALVPPQTALESATLLELRLFLRKPAIARPEDSDAQAT